MKADVTLLDVARAAQVSKTTASNVFNIPDRVRPELRARVEAAARELGYAGPDPRGRLLSSGKVNQIALVGPANCGLSYIFGSPYMIAFMQGTAEVCEEHGAGLAMIAANRLHTAVADGFILFSRSQLDLVEPALRRKVPFALMEEAGDRDVNIVTVDERGGARQLTEHLLALGHRKIAVATLTRDAVPPMLHLDGANCELISAWPCDVERLAGVGDALAAAGLSLKDTTVVEAWGSPEERRIYGFNWADLLLDNLQGATAIVALGGELALSVLATARQRGYRVPHDLSIVGFDDPPEAALTEPPLTVIEQPVRDIGRTAARLLLERAPPRRVVMPLSLKVRASAGPPPA